MKFAIQVPDIDKFNTKKSQWNKKNIKWHQNWKFSLKDRHTVMNE